MKKNLLFLLTLYFISYNSHSSYGHIIEVEVENENPVLNSTKYKVVKIIGMLLVAATLGLLFANYFTNEDTQKSWGLFGGSFGPTMTYACLLAKPTIYKRADNISKIVTIVINIVFGVLVFIGCGLNNADLLQFSGNSYENNLSWSIASLLLLNYLPIIILVLIYQRAI